MENGAEAAPAGTVTTAGTEAIAGASLRSVTVVRPAGAGAVSFTTLPSTVLPLVIEVAARFIEASAGSPGRMMIGAETVCPPNDAEMIATVRSETGEVMIVKLVELWPAGTNTLTGTTAWVSDEVSATVAPSAPEVPTNVTVFPVVVLPPVVRAELSPMVPSVGPTGFTAQPNRGPLPLYSKAPMSIAPAVLRSSLQVGWTYSYPGVKGNPEPVPGVVPESIPGEPAFR